MKSSKPKFVPKPGQVDYTNIRWAPVINCVLKHKDKILLVQRSSDMDYYPSYWTGVCGFLDTNDSLFDKVYLEMSEELGLSKKDVKKIIPFEVFEEDEPKYNKTWIIHPVLVEVKTNKVKTDWEAQNYKWVSLDEAWKMDLSPGFDLVLNRVSTYLSK